MVFDFKPGKETAGGS